MISESQKEFQHIVQELFRQREADWLGEVWLRLQHAVSLQAAATGNPQIQSELWGGA